MVLNALRNDREKGWRMLSDGSYILERDGGNNSSQEALYRYFSTRKVTLHEPSSPASNTAGAAKKDQPEHKGGLFGLFRKRN